jgi:hypothetical protein
VAIHRSPESWAVSAPGMAAATADTIASATSIRPAFIAALRV